jgi:hypothetical protein
MDWKKKLQQAGVVIIFLGMVALVVVALSFVFRDTRWDKGFVADIWRKVILAVNPTAYGPEYNYPAKVAGTTTGTAGTNTANQSSEEPVKYELYNIPVHYEVGPSNGESPYTAANGSSAKRLEIPVLGYKSEIGENSASKMYLDKTNAALSNLVFVCNADCPDSKDVLPSDLVRISDASGKKQAAIYYKVIGITSSAEVNTQQLSDMSSKTIYIVIRTNRSVNIIEAKLI